MVTALLKGFMKSEKFWQGQTMSPAQIHETRDTWASVSWFHWERTLWRWTGIRASGEIFILPPRLETEPRPGGIPLEGKCSAACLRFFLPQAPPLISHNALIHHRFAVARRGLNCRLSQMKMNRARVFRVKSICHDEVYKNKSTPSVIYVTLSCYRVSLEELSVSSTRRGNFNSPKSDYCHLFDGQHIVCAQKDEGCGCFESIDLIVKSRPSRTRPILLGMCEILCHKITKLCFVWHQKNQSQLTNQKQSWAQKKTSYRKKRRKQNKINLLADQIWMQMQEKSQQPSFDLSSGGASQPLNQEQEEQIL